MKKIIYLSLFLGLSASFATVLLAGINSITAPIIEEQRLAVFAQAVTDTFPNQEGFTVAAEGDEIPFASIVQILEVFEAGQTVGFIYSKEVNGFGGPMSYILGVDVNGNFVNFDFIAHGETPGFGDRLYEPAWYEQFRGPSIHSDIPIISGVTVTTSAIINALDDLRADFATR